MRSQAEWQQEELTGKNATPHVVKAKDCVAFESFWRSKLVLQRQVAIATSILVTLSRCSGIPKSGRRVSFSASANVVLKKFLQSKTPYSRNDSKSGVEEQLDVVVLGANREGISVTGLLSTLQYLPARNAR